MNVKIGPWGTILILLLSVIMGMILLGAFNGNDQNQLSEKSHVAHLEHQIARVTQENADIAGLGVRVLDTVHCFADGNRVREYLCYIEVNNEGAIERGVYRATCTKEWGCIWRAEG